METAADRTLHSSRVLPFPCEQVYRAWVEPTLLARWWGPKGFRNTFSEFAPHPGGVWRFVMHGPDGKDYPNLNRFVSLVPNQRIEIRHDCAPYFTLTATFTPAGHGTRLDFIVVFDDAKFLTTMRDFLMNANQENFDRLHEVLQPSETFQTTSSPLNDDLICGQAEKASPQTFELRFARIADAPLATLWRCWTEPELLKQWFCPKPWFVSDCDLELRPGGAFNTRMNGPNGESHWHEGCFLAVEAPHTLVWTDALLSGYRPAPNPFISCHLQLRSLPDGKTEYIATVYHANQASVEKHLEMGFEAGWDAAYQQLIALAKTL